MEATRLKSRVVPTRRAWPSAADTPFPAKLRGWRTGQGSRAPSRPNRGPRGPARSVGRGPARSEAQGRFGEAYAARQGSSSVVLDREEIGGHACFPHGVSRGGWIGSSIRKFRLSNLSNPRLLNLVSISDPSAYNLAYIGLRRRARKSRRWCVERA